VAFAARPFEGLYMKVQMLVSRAGPAGVDNRGDVVEVSAAEGKRMIEAAQAIPYAPKVKPERRTKKNVAKRKG